MSQTPRNTTDSKQVRCAIYTRKSSEEGLNKEFNSLEAQREAAEAYIKSQAHERWTCLPQRYDDGGFTGGNLERPALERLMADIESGQVDCVIVYKVDRLSRSLLDFARLMGTFDKHNVSFVAVTQQFNTATSMGRLVLNVLLSFAQFEREIISERTRDKIAAARRKGKWAGILAPLGYTVDPQGNKLRVHEDEAEKVRAIFKLYLERQALLPVVEELDQRGWASKRWQTKKGHFRGGQPFTKASLYTLLTHPAYIGQVRYKTEVHQGEHAGIVDPEVWKQVQDLLRQNGPGRRLCRLESGALLKGLLRCQACGLAMTPTYACKKHTIIYRYYICLNALKRGRQYCPSKSLPAAAIEQFVVAQLHALAQNKVAQAKKAQPEDLALWEPVADLAAWQALTASDQAHALNALVRLVDYDAASSGVTLSFQEGVDHKNEQELPVHSCLEPFRFPPRKSRNSVGKEEAHSTETKVPPVPRLARLMALALHLEGLIQNGKVKNYAELGRLGHVTRSRMTQIMNLLLLAPDIQEQILFLPPVSEGRDPIHLRRLQAVAKTFFWPRQRQLWSALLRDRAPVEPSLPIPEMSEELP